MGGSSQVAISNCRGAATSPFLTEPCRLFFALLRHSPQFILQLGPLTCHLSELFCFSRRKVRRLSVTDASSMTVGAMPFFLMLRRFRLRLEFLSPYAQLLSDRIGLGTRHQ